MTTIRIHEQIAYLRKRKGITQEALAKVLGVTNQAVSKWESAQCCPDIQLLPDIAEVFGVTVDELLGCSPAAESADLLLALRQTIDTLPKGEDFAFTFQAAAALHTILFSKTLTTVPGANPGWDTEAAIEHAGRAEWGYSCINIPEITTTLRKGTVLFSSNHGLDLHRNTNDVRRIVAILKDFAEYDTLRVASALYSLTVHAEDAYAAPEAISEACGISREKVCGCLESALASYVIEHRDRAGEYRFEGMYMNLIPLISLFDFK